MKLGDGGMAFYLKDFVILAFVSRFFPEKMMKHLREVCHLDIMEEK